MIHNTWFVITGGPSTGKTTLMHELADRGYAVANEAARVIIDKGIAGGKTIAQIRENEKHFQEIVARYKMQAEASLKHNELAFFDRGMHDTLAYLQAHDYPVAPWLKKLFKKSHYKKVFLLDPVGSFTRDYARTEDAFTRNKLQKLLEMAYTEYGMEPVRVPAMSPSERADFILKIIKEDTA